ncbi:MAG: AbgT family transporter [Bacteroidales bacterium]|nr:AbgT family transporter [Bacteroidales bacterium]
MIKKVPHTLAIIFSLILFCALLTWFVPSGKFDHQNIEVNGVERSVVVNNSYHRVENSPQTWQVFGSVLEGFEKQSLIIAFILIIGGAFQILGSSRAVDSGIFSFLNFTKGLEKYSFFRKTGVNNIVIILTMIMFSLFGSIFGMSEETLAFVVIIVPLAISMGYDSITGFLMVYAAAHIGFTGATLNPFTIGIAQGLSGLQLFSGIGYRIFCWALLTIFIIGVTLFWAARVKKNPALSPMYSADKYWREREKEAVSENRSLAKKATISTWAVFLVVSLILVLFSILYPVTRFTLGTGSYTFVCIPVATLVFIILGFISIRGSAQLFIMNMLAFTIIFLVIGVLGYQWYLKEISALFLAMGISSGAAYGLNTNGIVSEFISGAKDMLTAALVVGMAGGIITILEDGMILDTMLNSLAQTMENAGKSATVAIMYLIQTGINIFIPSGSAKAALTMPIMAPFSDVIGLSRQVTVMAYQFGDGITNMITPTSAVLIGALGIAKIPYEVWFKWFWKILVTLIVIGFLLLIPTIFIELQGF